MIMNDQMPALLNILEKSQWLTAEEIRHKQQKHLSQLILHARETVPFYARFYADIHSQDFQPDNILARLPVLKREHIQEAGEDFISQKIPGEHGSCSALETSGSTGKPVKVLGTDFTRIFYDALMLREHAWHQRDFTKTLMSIRWAKRGFAEAPQGLAQSTWGPPVNKYKTTGPSTFINVASSTPSQIDALLLYQPHYLMSYPSQLAALAEYCVSRRIELPWLDEIRTTGETFHPAYRRMIEHAWPGVKITDIYSTEEIGNIAQQCPEAGNYHVNTEHVICEIVDEQHRPCQSGQPGKVLLTALLNYATPLIRYEVGDYAEFGEACPCGRGMPVLKKILGRKRNRLILPDGESRFPYLGERAERNAITSAVRKFQFVQHTPHDIEYKAVVSEPLTLLQEEQLKAFLQRNLGFSFNITITYHAEIPLSATGKYEEFISLVSQESIHSSRQTT
ncbi:Phenylacetate-coenzyme A ligase [Aquicella siphonis]|uniref:Phenylacetate-coenzyme A ligase n=1 Tax=Aquicella siphonis TaxID=254247 RepID=A0A5E4PEI5_9COXI|nr:phenylacetate--CoA ligase family protein [Aquicella siphonis]VVC74771.1 Phenylacetate-coenzyme A ligase [Aquicella siphonis]